MKECGIELEQKVDVSAEKVKKIAEKLGVKVSPYMRASTDEETAEVEYEANRNRGATVSRPLERQNTKEGDI